MTAAPAARSVTEVADILMDHIELCTSPGGAISWVGGCACGWRHQASNKTILEAQKLWARHAADQVLLRLRTAREQTVSLIDDVKTEIASLKADVENLAPETRSLLASKEAEIASLNSDVEALTTDAEQLGAEVAEGGTLAMSTPPASSATPQ